MVKSSMPWAWAWRDLGTPEWGRCLACGLVVRTREITVDRCPFCDFDGADDDVVALQLTAEELLDLIDRPYRQ